LTGKSELVWEARHLESFDKMKTLIATDAVLTCPDHDEGFEFTRTLATASVVLSSCKMANLLPAIPEN
jgi:hypothetical protein